MYEICHIYYMTIGSKIRKKRLELGWSQEKLARTVNVSIRAVFKWEHDETIPRSDSLERLAKVFGVPLEWFFAEEGVPDPEIPPDILEAVKNPKMQAIVRALKPVIEKDD